MAEFSWSGFMALTVTAFIGQGIWRLIAWWWGKHHD